MFDSTRIRIIILDSIRLDLASNRIRFDVRKFDRSPKVYTECYYNHDTIKEQDDADFHLPIFSRGLCMLQAIDLWGSPLEMIYFLTITVIEDGVQELWRRITGNTASDAGASTPLWKRIVGYAWVFSWMCICMPWYNISLSILTSTGGERVANSFQSC